MLCELGLTVVSPFQMELTSLCFSSLLALSGLDRFTDAVVDRVLHSDKDMLTDAGVDCDVRDESLVLDCAAGPNKFGNWLPSTARSPRSPRLIAGWSGDGSPVVAVPGGRLDGDAPADGSGGDEVVWGPPGLSRDAACVPVKVSLFCGSINLLLY